NRNAGGGLFYPRDALAYRGTLQDWPAKVRELIRERAIDGVFVFGDGRAYHRKAIAVAEELGVRVFVFEEGYLRPDYITLERGGVTAYSRMPKDPEFFRDFAKNTDLKLEKPVPVGPTFRYAAWYSTLYSLALTLGF